MLHLKPHNLLVQKTLTEALEAYNNGSPLTLDRIISDYDYTTLHITNDDGDKSSLLVSIRTKATQSCNETGSDLKGFLEQKFEEAPGLALSGDKKEAGYDFTVTVNLSQITAESIVQVSLFKILVMSYPFYLAFGQSTHFSQLNEVDQVEKSKEATAMVIKYRDDENIYIKPSFDRVTVIFETIFQDETDKVFGKVFLQEFVDARKRNRFIQSAPQVLFSHEPPLEIQQVARQHASTAADKKSSRRFITFVLFPRHYASDELMFTSISQLALFRNYFHYHIKCAKAYMHSRMRYRVDTFIKVLNRAKVDDEGESESRRTFTGRKMVY
ncbi:unnamed protein product [Kluyveromyces dobzhanskii CBS 2104]|uniref:Arp2/3 complex 34 kDa subunit n=1 Tax=Kluyveromyces dobzhanskii CBS 2104 TaxID=1427455 RepID=A0A0A8L9R7_9SACH|nr:unnamed protein product [Kluyveromyces dobzhanskii CBS 2104]